MSGTLRGVQPVDPGYGIQGDQVTLREWRALLFHTIKRSGNGEEGWERAPEQQHIVLLNTEEIDPDRPEADWKQPDRIGGVDPGRTVLENVAAPQAFFGMACWTGPSTNVPYNRLTLWS